MKHKTPPSQKKTKTKTAKYLENNDHKKTAYQNL